jgi:cytochrome c oxidase subunit 2
MKRWLLLLVVLTLSLLVISVACKQSGSNPSVPSSSPAPSLPGPSITASPTPGGSPSVSNGQRVYFYSTSASGERITYTAGPEMMMQAPLACVTCHGPKGRGGTVQFMMQTFDVPNITWPELTAQHMDHAPYTEETLKQAITQGIDPAGNPLEYPMPRWQMSEQDLNDLISFIETLK